ncbi:MAG: histidinol-phosphatase [Chryseolinea sp.]
MIFRIQYAIILFSGLSAIASQGQSKSKKQWYKGNLHTHSYWSDGDEFPEMIMDWYKSNKYDFIALSDHNILADGDKWITVAKSKLYEDSFQKYLSKFGDQWVVHNMDSGRINVKLKTLKEYKPLFADQSFLIIQSEEITDKAEGKLIHMNATNVQKLIAPAGAATVTETMQRNVDAVLQQRKETGVPMFPHINHPNFFYAITPQNIIDLHGERFFEVYNGHPLVHNYGDSLHPGTEKMWDMINTAYYEKRQPLLYGLGTDDSHNYHQFGAAYANAGRGWVMVNAKSLSAADLIDAMEAGKFYASTGVVLNDVEFSNNILSVKIKSEPQVQYKIEFIGLEVGSKKVKVLQEIKNNVATFSVTPKLAFVRVRITSSKSKPNPYQEGDFEMAWTQPVSFEK